MKPSKLASKNTTYVVADSTAKEVDSSAARALRPALRADSKSSTGMQSQHSCEATLHSGYENIGGPLTHVNGKTSQAVKGKNGYVKNGFHTAVSDELGKVRSVPDIAILDIKPEAVGMSPPLAPRSYEALQVFDSAPRGFSLVQPS